MLLRAVRVILTHFFPRVFSPYSFVTHRDDPIPDPVKLLRRMAALESRIDQLCRDCVDVADCRQDIVLAVTDLQLKNAHILRKVRVTEMRCDQ